MNKQMIDSFSEIDIHAWAARVLAAGRMSVADLTALRNATYFGVPARCDLEALFRVERTLADTGSQWASLLCELVIDYVVWGERPTGRVTPEQADWLLQQVRRTGTDTAMDIGRTVAASAEQAPAWFLSATAAQPSRMQTAA